MLVTRNINDVEFDVDTQSSDTIYFEEDVADAMQSGEIPNIFNFLYEKGKSFLPLNVLLELTNGCNFSCLFCYIKNRKPFFRPYEEIMKDLEYLIDKGMLFCTLTGGECLSYPDFQKIYLFLKQKGVLVSIYTNASLLTDGIVEMLKMYPPEKIEVSVYGIDEERFFATTDQQRVSPSVVLQNILRLKSEGFKVTCKTPINKLTQGQFFKIKQWMESHQVDYYYSDELLDTYEGVSVQQYLRDDPEVVAFINARERKITEFNTTSEIGQRLYFDCKAGKYSLCISNYGVLMPCQAANGLEPFMFDINKLGIDQALDGLIKLIEKYKGKPLEYCKGCMKHKACSECLISQLKQKDLYSYMQQHCYEMNPNKL